VLVLCSLINEYDVYSSCKKLSQSQLLTPHKIGILPQSFANTSKNLIPIPKIW
jgi:hypothetical protein